MLANERINALLFLFLLYYKSEGITMQSCTLRVHLMRKKGAKRGKTKFVTC